MKEQQEQLSDAQISAELLRNTKPHSSYVEVEGMPIPYNNGMLIKHLPRAAIISSLIDLEDGGKQEIFEAAGNNTQDTCEGIIMSVGPGCSPVIRRGLKIQFSTAVKNQAPVFTHKREKYLGMDEYAILFFMPDETTTVDMGVKDPKQVRRENKMPKEQEIINKMHQRDQNEKDKQKDKTKGKIKPVSTKLR